jgi:cell wall-associated NlpC family hydrolase
VQAREARWQELEAARLELERASAEVTRLEQEVAIARVEAGSGSLDGLLPAPPTEAAGRVIDYAVSQLGVPYQWGGNHGFSLEQMIATEPNLAYGFDCSSFLAWSFARGAGLYIGDWTVSQWEYGVTAPGATRGPGPAQGGGPPPGGYLPGDIVFFNDTDHVGLAIGNDLFVQAPRTGDVVKISRLSEYTPVWGWVRYSQISGIETAPAEDGAVVAARPADPGERVFVIVEEPA